MLRITSRPIFKPLYLQITTVVQIDMVILKKNMFYSCARLECYDESVKMTSTKYYAFPTVYCFVYKQEWCLLGKYIYFLCKTASFTLLKPPSIS